MKMDKKINNFQTYAVFDLETTGLPDYNFNKANITEFSIATIPKDEMINTKRDSTYRILNKLSLLFNPRMVIHPESSKITGLDNYMLEHENSFDENAANTIIGFLKHLRGPICLVAHNGDKFDFPIFKKAFDKLNIELPENVYCVDSLRAFQHIDHKNNLKDIEKEQLLDLEEEFFKENFTLIDLTKDEEILNSKEEKIDIQQKNETTPHRKKKQASNWAQHSFPELRRSRGDILANHDETPANESTPTNLLDINEKGGKAKRKLFKPLSSKSKDLFKTPNKDNNKIPRSPKGYYTLSGIFKRLFYEPKKSHHAEADVDMLRQILIHYGEEFVQYTEENAKPFSEIKCLKVVIS